MQTLPDPRQYTLNYPQSNIIIHQGLAALKEEHKLDELVNALINVLEKENDALINVALNLAPSFEVADKIWYALDLAIGAKTQKLTDYANIFAIPLVLVAGSKVKAQLKDSISTDKLNQFMYDKGIFSHNVGGFISGKLLDPQTLAQIKPSQLYYWVRNIKNAKLWLPLNLNGTGIEVLNEGVFLRFLVGVTIDTAHQSMLNYSIFKEHAMDLMRFINQELATAGVTLFPIPFPPTSLFNAFNVGDTKRKEIAIQVAISNTIREIRSRSLTPIAGLATESDAIKIVVRTKEESDIQEVSLWRLSRIDDFKLILDNLVNLFKEMQVDVNYGTS